MTGRAALATGRVAEGDQPRVDRFGLASEWKRCGSYRDQLARAGQDLLAGSIVEGSADVSNVRFEAACSDLPRELHLRERLGEIRVGVLPPRDRLEPALVRDAG